MALRFFYRRQKLVFIIMVILMVSFLIGFQGFEMFFGGSGGSRVMGRTAWGKVRVSDGWAAEADLNLLRSLPMDPRRPEHALTAYLLDRLEAGSEQHRALAYLLLLEECKNAHVRITQREVDGFLAGWGFAVDGGKALMLRLRSIDRNLTEARLRSTVAGFLMVYKNYALCTATGEPSEREAEHLYRDLHERITLRVARLRAEDFVSDIKDNDKKAMTQPAILHAQFEQYRKTDPDTYEKGSNVSEAFEFGYRHAEPRVNILYAVVKQPAIEEIVESSEKNAGSEEKLAKLASAKMDALAKQVSGLLAEYAKLKEPPKDMLEFCRTVGFVRGADELLDTRLAAVYIDSLPLQKAVRELASKAGAKVAAIFLPVGIDGLDVTKEVTLLATDITLRDALDRLISEAAAKTRQAKESTTKPATRTASDKAKEPSPPKWQWVTIKGLEGVLFPAGGDAGLESLPIMGPVETGLLTKNQLYRQHIVLAYSATPAGQRIDGIAFTADKLTDSGHLISVGQAGENLVYVGGITLWRLRDAAPPGEPTELTSELREQVERDLQTKKAFELALDYARQVKQRAEKDDKGLRLAAKDDTKVAKVFETTPLARKAGMFLWNSIYDPEDLEPTPYELRMFQTDPNSLEENLEQLRRQKRVAILSSVPEEHAKEIIKMVFELAPRNLEPPYPDKPVVVKIIPVARTREVFLVERIGYEPPARDEYAALRREMVMLLKEADVARCTGPWFALDNIKKRTGYRQEGQ